MADGGLTLNITLDDATLRRLKAAADRAGQTIGDYASGVIARKLDDGVEDWSETLRRFEEYDRTGESEPAEEILAQFQANVAARSRRRA